MALPSLSEQMRIESREVRTGDVKRRRGLKERGRGRGGAKSGLFDTRPSSCYAVGRAPNYLGSIDGLKSHWPLAFGLTSSRFSVICARAPKPPTSLLRTHVLKVAKLFHSGEAPPRAQAVQTARQRVRACRRESQITGEPRGTSPPWRGRAERVRKRPKVVQLWHHKSDQVGIQLTLLW